MLEKFIDAFDVFAIETIKKIALPVARLALFVIFFWFGILKVLELSPAEMLVGDLLQETMPFIPVSRFVIWFGVYEMVIGAVFLIPTLERLAIALLVPHMIATFLPLVLLPDLTWQGFFVPTLEGQYILKNMAIIALAIGLAATLNPFHFSKEQG